MSLQQGMLTLWTKGGASKSQAGFLLRILWHSESGNQPENNVAKFGYLLDMKVKQ
jgi:hypothetical protein